MISGPEGDELGIVGWRWDADGAGAAYVGVAELVSHLLQVVRLEVVVVPQDVVVTRPTCALNTLVRAKVKVELGGVGDAYVDGGAGRDVAWNGVRKDHIIRNATHSFMSLSAYPSCRTVPLDWHRKVSCGGASAQRYT